MLSLSAGRDRLSITVRDGSARPPTPRPRDPRRVGGHGLLLVRAVSEEFSIVTRVDGKDVTAELLLTPGA
jgi:anti-sigma regulatory factor (Ser/Thr protein kinase)